MKVISVEKLDGPGGSVIAGDPVDGDLVRITYSNGDTRETIYRDKPTPPIRVFVHVTVTGPVVNGIVSIPNDGATAATIEFTLRGTENPTSAVLSSITRVWSVALRDPDGNVYDYLGLRFVDGTTTIQYTNTKASLVTMQHKDVDDIIGTAIVTLATAPRFLVYRDFV